MCHSAPDIGLRTTKGLPLADRTVKRAFHRELIEQDCTACHSDHVGPKLTHRSRKPFSHALLRAAVRVRCESCHAKPADTIHQELGVGCAQCHKAESWKPATFKHALLADAVLARCEGCHKTPVDSLHRQVKGTCKQCHSQDHWKPTTFDHDKLFLLDRDHTTECATCHTNDEYSRYTCYGCHEHRQDKVRLEHEEEGIRDFENCVECHPSASDKPEKKGSHRGTKRD